MSSASARQDEGAQVACLAENTGGQYIEADNADALTEALSRTVLAAAPTANTCEFFDDANFTGNRLVYNGQQELAWLGADWDDKIMSMRCTPDCAIKMYDERDFGGEGIQITGEQPSMPGQWDASISSLKMACGADKSVLQDPVKVVLPEATLKAAETAVILELSVDWTGPNAKGDYIEMVIAGETDTVGVSKSYAYTADGNPASVNVPGNTGDYELRYIWEGPEGRVVLAAQPVTVIDSEFALAALTGPTEGRRAISVGLERPRRRSRLHCHSARRNHGDQWRSELRLYQRWKTRRIAHAEHAAIMRCSTSLMGRMAVALR